MENKDTNRKFARVLREDIRNTNFIREFKHELKELREFYLTEEQKKNLETMGRVKSVLYLAYSMTRSLFFHLTPMRRILTAVGLFIVLFGTSILVDNGSLQINNTGLVGGGIIFIVLMLELKDKLLAKDELEAGRKVQRALTPERSPKVPGWSIWLFTRPANEVGGDLVDYLSINDDRVGIILADVAGKGLHAALLMAKLQATIRALAADFDSLSRLVSKINSIFYRDSLKNIFASMVYVEIKPGDTKLGYVNAGHFPPMIIQDNIVKETSKGNVAIGMTKDFSYREEELSLAKGEIFFAYSDGVTEAKNEEGKFFDKDRLINTLSKLSSKNVDEIGESVVGAVDNFVGDAPVNDDLSLIIIRKDD